MPRILALLLLGGIVFAGCDAAVPRHGGGGAQHTTIPTMEEPAGDALRESADEHDAAEPQKVLREADDGREPLFPLLTIGTLLESFRLR